MKLKAKHIALISIYAALYAVLVVILGALSYGPVQIRVADSMLAAVPLLGVAGVLGHTLGVFVANIFSTAGVLDLLNTIPSFAMAFVSYYVYKHAKNDYAVLGTFVAYSAVLATTVGWMLSYLYTLPLLATIAYVFIGNLVATTLIGWPLYKALQKIAPYFARLHW